MISHKTASYPEAVTPEKQLEEFKQKYNLTFTELAGWLGKQDGTVRAYLFRSKNKKNIPNSVIIQIKSLDQLWQLSGKPNNTLAYF